MKYAVQFMNDAELFLSNVNLDGVFRRLEPEASPTSSILSKLTVPTSGNWDGAKQGRVKKPGKACIPASH